MPLFAGSGVWRKYYLGLVKFVSDLFNRATTGGLGASTSGTSWRAVIGTWTAANGVATTADAPTNHSIATVLMPSPSVTLIANNVKLGTGLSFWVQDANNWFGVAGIENDTSYTYYTSCNCTPAYSCAGWTTNGPFPYSTYVSCCTSYNCGAYDAYSGNFVTHFNCSYTVTGNYYTASCSSWSTYYNCQSCGPYTGSTAAYFIQLWQSVSGTASVLLSSTLSAILSSIKVILGSGSTPSISATAYSDNTQTTSVGSISSSATSTATANQHGIIIVPSVQNQGNTIGSFSATAN